MDRDRRMVIERVLSKFELAQPLDLVKMAG
jgi:hypothetical protein